MSTQFQSHGHAEDVILRHRYKYYILGKPTVEDWEYDGLDVEARETYGSGVWDTVGSSNPADYPKYVTEGRRPNAEEREARDEAITQRILESL